jgi:acetyl-CoA C-acetyltransferase
VTGAFSGLGWRFASVLGKAGAAVALMARRTDRLLNLVFQIEAYRGRAVALDHPFGATGAILIGSMVDELERRGLKRGVVTMCAAGGMAPAIIIERV